MLVKHAYGPTITSDDLPNGPQSIGDKIRVFEDRLRGWKLDIAKEAIERNGHAGFAVLDIVTSYFELMGLCTEGRGKKTTVPAKGGGTKEVNWGSGDYFRSGMRHVFPELHTVDASLIERLLKAFYKDVRCGLYHQAMTRHGVLLSGAYPRAITFHDIDGKTLIYINPGPLVEHLQAHLSDYILHISDPANVDSRNLFEDVFDNW